jgi:aspartyl/glutamyl-tRNA(Asn/Gln) amidotransferase C subunit
MAEINEKVLDHLAELSRIEIEPDKKGKLLKDFKSILGHFEGLADLDISKITPMTGGTSLKNITREDEFNSIKDTGKGVEAFPESKDGYLKVPPVFE